MTAQKIAACPWDDGAAYLSHLFGPDEWNLQGAWHVQCSECGASGPEISGGDKAKAAKHEAVKQWNRLAMRKVNPSVA